MVSSKKKKREVVMVIFVLVVLVEVNKLEKICQAVIIRSVKGTASVSVLGIPTPREQMKR